jgi:hypothetical protein
MLSKPDGSLHSGLLYKMLKTHGEPPTPTPPSSGKAKGESKDRLQTRVNLHKKRILDSDIDEVCASKPETMFHMFFHCSFAHDFWAIAGITIPQTCTAPTSMNLLTSMLSKDRASTDSHFYDVGTFGNVRTLGFSEVSSLPLTSDSIVHG